jgi:hypothetical protein
VRYPLLGLIVANCLIDKVRSLSIILQGVDVGLSERQVNDQRKTDLQKILGGGLNILNQLQRHWTNMRTGVEPREFRRSEENMEATQMGARGYS